MVPHIHSEMEIIGSDGGRLGRVNHVVGDDIELADVGPDGARRRRLIPVSWVHDINGDQIRLNLNEGAAKAAWRDVH
jgi:hypothetical protein